MAISVKYSQEALRFGGIFSEGVYAGPENVFLDITSVCNYSCVSCWIHSSLRKTPKDHAQKAFLPLEHIKKVIQYARMCESTSVSISGDGEPLLHPHIGDVVDAIVRAKKRLIITTNLSCSKEVLKKILRVDALYVHIDALDPTRYMEIHGPGEKNCYGRVMDNLIELFGRNRRGFGPEVHIIHLIHALNYKQFPDMVKFFMHSPAQGLSFRPFEASTFNKNLQLSSVEKKEFLKILEKTIHMYKDKICARSNILENYNDLRGELTQYRFQRCFSGWFNMLVDFKGDVFICCHNDFAYIGNIYKDDIRDIWGSRAANKKRIFMRDCFSLKKPVFAGQCQRCWWARKNTQLNGLFEKIRKVPCFL